MKQAAIVALATLLRCSDPPPPPQDERILTISDFPTADPTGLGAIPPASASASTIAIGPAAPSDPQVTPAMRRAAVMKLLEGGDSATPVPVVDADPGDEFERNRRFQLFDPRPVGKLPPEVIQRVVRRHPRIRACYQLALKDTPDLRGEVTVTFMIARDGSVGSVRAAKSALPAATVSCIVKAFFGLEFPSPGNASQSVVFPLTFTSHNDAAMGLRPRSGAP